MNEQPPSLSEWRNLYDAALKFKELECWDFMEESDIFGVKNPVNGEIGYCCIMGGAGEHFALAVYMGTEGLEGYMKIRSGEYIPPAESLHLQKCLMASFEDRKYLSDKDRKIIKKLRLKFRGRNAWTLLRSYLPGYHPWYLTGDEARYLTLTLQQVIGVCHRFEDDPDMLTSPDDGAYDSYLVRVPVKEEDGMIWKDEWVEPEPIHREIVTDVIDENRLKEIKKIASKGKNAWEMDFFFTLQGVQENKDERPYYPRILLLVDHHSSTMLNYSIPEPPEYRSEIREHILDTAYRTKSLPKKIMVRREEVFELLEPIAAGLGIELIMVRELPAIESAEDFVTESFGMFE